MILSAVLASGETIIRNVAMEPEIIDLQNFLNRMGAKISGAGSNIIRVKGVKKLKEISYNIMSDRIETGTFLSMAAMTGGNIELLNADSEYIVPILNKLEEAGCRIYKEKKKIILNAPKRLKAIGFQTFPYPGFPTDMQSIFLAMLTVAKGTAIVTENIFENRFKCVPELVKMKANILVNGNSAVVIGQRRLVAKDVVATDLRGGAALVCAGVKAKGITTIENCEIIERGYENLDTKLKSLNVEIQKIDN